jgi:nitroreductase
MELFEALKERRSYRAYEDKPVAEGVIKELLEAAVYAPSGMDAQPWAFVIIEDQEYMKDLSDRAKKLVLAELEKQGISDADTNISDPAFNIYYEAPVLICIYADKNIDTYIQDASLAAQNLMLAAHGKGLASCWIHDTLFFDNEIKAKYKLPANYAMVAPIVVGYPAGEKPVVEHQEPKILAWVK